MSKCGSATSRPDGVGVARPHSMFCADGTIAEVAAYYSAARALIARLSLKIRIRRLLPRYACTLTKAQLPAAPSCSGRSDSLLLCSLHWARRAALAPQCSLSECASTATTACTPLGKPWRKKSRDVSAKSKRLSKDCRRCKRRLGSFPTRMMTRTVHQRLLCPSCSSMQ